MRESLIIEHLTQQSELEESLQGLHDALDGMADEQQVEVVSTQILNPIDMSPSLLNNYSLKEATRMLIEKRAQFSSQEPNPMATSDNLVMSSPAMQNISYVVAITPRSLSLNATPRSSMHSVKQNVVNAQSVGSKLALLKKQKQSGNTEDHQDFGIEVRVKSTSSPLGLFKQRFCVLQDGVLFFFKDQHQSESRNATPKFCIALKHIREMLQVENLQLRVVVKKKQSAYIFQFDCALDVDLFVTMINSQLLRVIQLRGASLSGVKMSGYLNVFMKGVAKTRYVVLNGAELQIYYNHKSMTPLLSIVVDHKQYQLHVESGKQNLVCEAHHCGDGAHQAQPLESLYHSAASHNFRQIYSFCLVSSSNAQSWQDQIWFTCKRTKEFERWIDHLGCLCFPTLGSQSTLQQSIHYLFHQHNNDMVIESLPDWLKLNDFFYQNCRLSSSLTSLCSDYLRNEALCINKAILLFSSIVITDDAVGYHCALVQALIQSCLAHQSLQTELLLQLLKQTIDHPYPESSYTLQCWQLLLLCFTFFKDHLCQLTHIESLTVQFIRSVLQWHLNCSSSGLIAHQYASKSMQVLESAQQFHQVQQRKCPPSRVEVLSFITANVAKKIAVTVKCRMDIVKVYAVDSLCSCETLLDMICEDLQLENESSPGQVLFGLVFPQQSNRLLEPYEYVADLLYNHEQKILKTMDQNVTDCSQFILALSINWIPSCSGNDQAIGTLTQSEKLLLASQFHQQFVMGDYCLDRQSVSQAVHLSAILAFSLYGQYDVSKVNTAICQLLPDWLLKRHSRSRTMSGISKRSGTMLIKRFLTTPRKVNENGKGPQVNDNQLQQGRFIIPDAQSTNDVQYSPLADFSQQWMKLADHSAQQCVDDYLNQVLTWKYAMYKQFSVKINNKRILLLINSSEMVCLTRENGVDEVLYRINRSTIACHCLYENRYLKIVLKQDKVTRVLSLDCGVHAANIKTLLDRCLHQL
ncbi:hypothetical protein MP228_011524 [Amoeboaphelidium protococcarum]|nr:hypothetical protein MP228_011524 [Amoeboaphelidium protococcarum]